MRTARTIRQTHREKAFTIVEILLAIAIFSMVLAAIYASWSSILRGSRIGLTAAAEVQRTRMAVRSLEESLGSAVLYADNPRYYSFFADTGGEYTYLSFVARLPESFLGSGLFPDQPLRRITFLVDSDKNLEMTQTPILQACEMVDHPYTITLAPQVSVFAMEFFDQRRNEWLPQWTLTNQLPRMVRVAIGFGKKDQTPENVTMRIIPLSAVAITRAGPGGVPPTAAMPGNRILPRNNGEAGWTTCLPSTFGTKNDNLTRNPIFPQ